MIRRLAAAGLVLHGAIHLIGFVSPWQIAALGGFAYRTTVLGGAAEVGDVGVRLIGLLWLGLTAGFLTSGYAVLHRRSWAIGLTGVIAVVSLIVCIAGLPETFAGVAINVLILATVSYVAFHQSRSIGHTERSIS